MSKRKCDTKIEIDVKASQAKPGIVLVNIVSTGADEIYALSVDDVKWLIGVLKGHVS